MKRISDYKLNIPDKPKFHSEHQECIARVLEFMGEDNSQFGKWCKLLKGRSPREVHDMIKHAERDGKKPRALFRWLIKNK